MARGVAPDEILVVLLSGGASALMCAPLEGISLSDKIATTRTMMEAGADIVALNTVRRHLSQVKGGRLAQACRGLTVTLAISDVVGDSLNAIGSGPAVPDPTTWNDAASALERWGGSGAYAAAVVDAVRRGTGWRDPRHAEAGRSGCDSNRCARHRKPRRCGRRCRPGSRTTRLQGLGHRRAGRRRSPGGRARLARSCARTGRSGQATRLCRVGGRDDRSRQGTRPGRTQPRIRAGAGRTVGRIDASDRRRERRH